MAFEETYFAGVDPQPVAAGEIDSLEAHYGTAFPAGYREFLTAFGGAAINGFLRVFAPQEILDTLESEFRPRWQEDYFWDEDPELSKEQVLGSIIIGDTVGGDELVFLPGKPEDIYLLPRDSENLPRIGGSLEEVVAWIHDGNLQAPVKQNYIAPVEMAQRRFGGGPAWAEVAAVVDQVFGVPVVAVEEHEDGECVARIYLNPGAPALLYLMDDGEGGSEGMVEYDLRLPEADLAALGEKIAQLGGVSHAENQPGADDDAEVEEIVSLDDLSGEDLFDEVEFIDDGLTQLTICDCADLGKALATFDRFERLWDLDIRDTALGDAGLEMLSKFPLAKSVTKLELENAGLGDPGLAQLAAFANLENLGLTGENNSFTGKGLAALKGLTKLVNLDLSDNDKLTDNDLEPLGEMKQLEDLCLPEQISDAAVENLQRALPEAEIDR